MVSQRIEYFCTFENLPEDEFPREFDILATREFANDEDKDIDEMCRIVGFMRFGDLRKRVMMYLTNLPSTSW